ncbi:O-antigen ligase family protein [Termitidicoccus mucosus]|uniref:O-antigen ligase family protein n=2 Tax=Termitidicoccus mucosus TaxID=1184151 RepID=UPI00318424BA
MNPLYYYNGSLRWSFYWENPNCWAVFLVFVLVGSWTAVWMVLPRMKTNGQHGVGGLQSLSLGARCFPRIGRRFLRVLFAVHALELAVWVLLVKTYSRGGLVAAFAALALFFLLDKNIPSRRVRLASILIRLVAVGVLCMGVGFSSRFSPDYIVQDKSVLNRLDMWQGALVMMKDSPWIGWGNHNGGFSYINWYQPLATSTHPIGFVNSFFDIAVEFGAPVLCFILGIGFFLLFVAFRHRKTHATTPALVILAAWGLANVWTSLWRETALWIVPAGCGLYLLTVCYRSPRVCLKSIAPAFALAAGLGVLLWSSGWAFSGKYEWIARPNRGTDKITLIKRTFAEGAGNAPEVLVDGAVFGRYFGKTFRGIAATTTKTRFEIYPPWSRKPENSGIETGKIIYSGFHASWLSRRGVLPSHEIAIFYPTVFPPPIEAAGIGASRVSLYMPLASASEYNLAWRRWAERNSIQIITTPQGGLRIEPAGNKKLWRQLLE